MTSPEALSSFNFAISIHSVAPRIEAHYQFYNTAVKPRLIESGAEECALWVELGGEQICSIEVWGSGKMVYSYVELSIHEFREANLSRKAGEATV